MTAFKRYRKESAWRRLTAPDLTDMQSVICPIGSISAFAAGHKESLNKSLE